MEDLMGFINDLKEKEFTSVAIDVGEYNLFVSLDNLYKEIEGSFGISEVVDTYYEDLSFISNNGEFIEIHAIY